MVLIPAAFCRYEIVNVPCNPDTYADTLFTVCPELKTLFINTNARPGANIVRIE